MKFIYLTGEELLKVMEEDEYSSYSSDELKKEGLDESTEVRINPQGDIEILKTDGWDVIGGLLGDFSQRIERRTGKTWADAT
ncbi:Hypothetical protein PBC10988_40750 [Planctomycetales bacterium 10988]|nr:Hypothetical protein PBC10988_40750 [Planctomycetales bacterium 10988]